jgi:putative ABC transport system ATP-binding protein
MVNKPDIVFADEPCANLDSENSKMVLDLFHELNEEMQQTIVMVSHEEWHRKYFHRIITLHDGHVVGDRKQDHGHAGNIADTPAFLSAGNGS